MTMPFVLLQAQNDHRKGMVIMRLFCGCPPGEQNALLIKRLNLFQPFASFPAVESETARSCGMIVPRGKGLFFNMELLFS
jgi:hypothetical protein